MKTTCWVGCCLFFAAGLCRGGGIVTILDGNTRVLRGVYWHKLTEGTRLQDGDVIDAADQAQVPIGVAAGRRVLLKQLQPRLADLECRIPAMA